MKEFFSQIHYNSNLSLIQKLAGCVLSIGIPFYSLCAELKNWLYDRKILKSKIIDNAYVISIGNITTGGVGKTPIVAEIANSLCNCHKVAIISRGYGGNLPSKNINLVKQDSKIFYTANECGDEPFWLSENTDAKVCVITCKNRVLAGKFAVEKLGCDILILDDAFQHRKIARDLDIIVFDAAKLFGNGIILPLGPLREGLHNAKRADKILITNKNLTQKSFDNISLMIKEKFSKPVIQTNFTPKKYYNIKNETEISLKNKNIAAFCAIGQPESFYNYLSTYKPKFVKTFEDHHKYTQKDIDNLIKKANEQGAQILVTTEKDAVKLIDFNFQNIQFCAMKLGIDMNTEELLGEKT